MEISWFPFLGYFHGYGPGLSCTWDLQVPDGFRVKLDILDLNFDGDGHDCYEDRLDLYQGLFVLFVCLLAT